MGGLIAVCIYLRSKVDRSSRLASMPVPHDPDPYQIAYLRGGTTELIRLATVVELFHQKVLTEVTGRFFNAKKWEAVTPLPADIPLDPIPLEVAKYYQHPRNPTDIFKSDVVTILKEYTQGWDQWMEENEWSSILLNGKSKRTSSRSRW